MRQGRAAGSGVSPARERIGVSPGVAAGRMMLAGLAGLVLVAAGAGCSRPASEPDGGRTPTPTHLRAPSPTAEDRLEAARSAALAAYRGMWTAFSNASRVADPQHPDLARYAMGDALAVLVAGLEANRREGLVSDGGEVVLYPEVVDAQPPDAPTEVGISDCADTSNTRRVRPSGPAFTDSPGGWRQVTATVELVDGVWKVTGFAVQGVGSCAPNE